jgi:hypothetical protein
MDWFIQRREIAATRLDFADPRATLYFSALGVGSVLTLVPCIGFVGS